MFVIDEEATFEAPVVVVQPGGAQQRFVVVFRVPTEDDAEAIAAEDKEKRVPPKDRVKRLLVGWREVVDGKGQAIEFTPQNVDLAVRRMNVVDAILRAYWESLSEAREKNWSAPRSTGYVADAER